MSDVLVGLSDFHGTVLRGDDEGYDEARAVFNRMIDRRPALILQCATTADVATAVRYAREERLEISVYGGGHGVTGSAVCEGGACIDLRGLNQLDVDVDRQVVRAGGGVTWGRLDAATQEHGLAVTGGRVSSTGVGGLALGSGSGWLERKLGYTCDNLLEAEVVTAAGGVVTASPTENPDLFWALRGGGGNFGIVTTFTFQLHRVGPLLYGGMLLFPAERAVQVTRAFRNFMATAPDDVGGALAFITAPPEDFVPEPARGRPVVGVICCYTGDPADGPAAYAPLSDLGPAMAMLGPMPYVAVQQLLDAGNPAGRLNYWTADFYDALPDEAVEELCAIATAPVSPFGQVVVMPAGGAVARVDEDATAFGSRNAAFSIHYLSVWTDEADTTTNIQHTRRLASTMKPWSTGGVYLNFLGDEGAGRVQAAFGPDKFARLQRIKSEWDPDNLFHLNQNIPPAG